MATSAIPAFINPRAGGAAKAGAAIKADRRFAARELSPHALAEAMRDEVARGTARVLVCGGDGTLSTALGAAAGASHEVALFPGGTLNHFARDFGLPLDDTAALLEIAVTGRPVLVDLGYVNDHVILNTSSVGTYVEFVRHREASERWLGYHLASAVAGIRVWLRPQFLEVELLQDDGTRRPLQTPLIFVGVEERILDRNRFGERLPGGGHALHIVVVNVKRRSPVSALLRTLARLGQNLDSYVKSGEIEARLASDFVAIIRRSPGSVAIDGELVTLDSPLRFAFKRGAVSVVGQTATR